MFYGIASALVSAMEKHYTLNFFLQQNPTSLMGADAVGGGGNDS